MKKTLATIATIGLIGGGAYKYFQPNTVLDTQDIAEQVNPISPEEYRVLGDTQMSGYTSINGQRVTLDNDNYFALAHKVSEQSPTTKNLFDPHYNLEDLLLSIMMVESRGNKDSVSQRTGATGIMQLMPRTAEQCNLVDNGGEIDTHRIKQMDCAVDQLYRAHFFLQDSVKDVFGSCYSADDVNKITKQFAISAYNNGMGDVKKAVETFGEEQISCPWLARLYRINPDQVVPTVLANSGNSSLRKDSREYLPKVEMALGHIKIYNNNNND